MKLEIFYTNDDDLRRKLISELNKLEVNVVSDKVDVLNESLQETKNDDENYYKYIKNSKGYGVL